MSTTAGRWIDVPAHDGGPFAAWLVTPPATPRAEPAPGIVVLQEIWGVNAHIRSVAEQYASDGYVVLAPDLFWRMKPRVDLGYDEAGTKEAFGYRKAIDVELADRDVAATVAALRGLDGVSGAVGVVGYCMGGMLAYRANARGGALGQKIDGAACYYGGGIASMLDLATSADAPMLMHFGEKDTHITPDHVAAIRAALAGRDDVDIRTYAAADHGFNCWARPSYHQPSAALAHGRSLAFFATTLSR